jgi:hypothetical protein
MNKSAVLVSLSLALTSCNPSPELGVLVFEDSLRELAPEPVPHLLATDKDGLVLLDLDQGARLAHVALEPEDGAHVVDLSVSSALGASHAVVSVLREDEEGELLGVDLSSPDELGVPKRLASYSGELRAVALPEGALVFQRGDGARWLLARFDRAHVPSVACPIPSSIPRVELLSESSVRVHAFAVTEGLAELLRAEIEGPELTCARLALPLPPPVSDSARLVHLGSDGGTDGDSGTDLVVDARGGAVAIAHATPEGAAKGFVATLAAASRIEAALASDELVVAVTSGHTSPSAVAKVVALRVAFEADGTLSVTDLAEVDLAAPVEEARFGYLRLATVSGDRIVVATQGGLEAWTLDRDDWTLTKTVLAGDLQSGPSGHPIVTVPRER